jgi:hypothetical protein
VYGVLSHVQKLQLSLDGGYLRTQWQDYGGVVFDLFANVTHLPLSLGLPCVSGPARDRIEETKILLKRLKPLTRLESLYIEGPWCYDEDDLVSLISAHGDRLKLFMLCGPSITDGSWESAVSRVLSLRLNNMMYLQFSMMQVYNDDTSNFEADWPLFVERVSPYVERFSRCAVFLSANSGPVRDGRQYMFRPPSSAAESGGRLASGSKE